MPPADVGTRPASRHHINPAPDGGRAPGVGQASGMAGPPASARLRAWAGLRAWVGPPRAGSAGTRAVRGAGRAFLPYVDGCGIYQAKRRYETSRNLFVISR
ncbi:hypothetical protein Jiend_37290 [Micromonospora endophytica]|nr:hypothetical protein Jiend_37290 [Micromonospora endophytica]